MSWEDLIQEDKNSTNKFIDVLSKIVPIGDFRKFSVAQAYRASQKMAKKKKSLWNKHKQDHEGLAGCERSSTLS